MIFFLGGSAYFSSIFCAPCFSAAFEGPWNLYSSLQPEMNLCALKTLHFLPIVLSFFRLFLTSTLSEHLSCAEFWLVKFSRTWKSCSFYSSSIYFFICFADRFFWLLLFCSLCSAPDLEKILPSFRFFHPVMISFCKSFSFFMKI